MSKEPETTDNNRKFVNSMPKITNKNEELRERVLDIIQISATPERATDRILELIAKYEKRGYDRGHNT